MTEEQGSQGIEGLGRRMWHAETGRYFLFKWVLISAACQALSLPIRLMAPQAITGVRLTWWFWVAMLAPSILLTAFQAFVLFRWRWRTWMWIALHLFGTFSVIGWRSAYSALFLLPLIEAPLFIGIRKRPGLWILCRFIGIGLQFALSQTGYIWTSDFRAWFSANTPLPNWIDPVRIAFQSVQFLTVILTGSALAWLMPPVEEPRTRNSLFAAQRWRG